MVFFFLTSRPYGFRPKHSTEYTALELIDRIINKMDLNEIPIDIFLDLSKAFDKIDHTILLHKLKYYGLEQSTLGLIESHLKNRKQYTEIEESKSEILPLTIGVPEGSILGPLLFIIYINDFSESTKKFDFIIYADDTTLSSTINSFYNEQSNVDTQTLINDELSKIIEWLNINKLSLFRNHGQLCQSEAKLTNSIAKYRIHVERDNVRLKDFKALSFIPAHLRCYAEKLVNLFCVFVNLQG